MKLFAAIRGLVDGADETVRVIDGLVPVTDKWAFPFDEWRQALTVLREFLDNAGDAEALRRAAEKWKTFTTEVSSLASSRVVAEQLEALNQSETWSDPSATDTYPAEFGLIGDGLTSIAVHAQALADGLNAQAELIDAFAERLDDVVGGVVQALRSLHTAVAGGLADPVEGLRPAVAAVSNAFGAIDGLFDIPGVEIDPVCQREWRKPSFV